ncbi:LCP family protein [Kitasatospora mediocidica]|uniref:LCP family protein n=1 Tax=Kitasatospora mediocidica TaxID=58352 RepID=UPI000A04546B|nr:LCP family protein [Kitasatospora mediocidica]
MPAPRSVQPRTAAPRRRRWGRRLSGAVAVAVLATAGAGCSVLDGVGETIGRVDAFGPGADRPPSDDSGEDGGGADRGGSTFLVVGTDDREGIPVDLLKNTLHAGGESCHCTDAMMLVRLGGPAGRAAVVSIPRDSYVDIPAHLDPATHRQVPAGKGKINAAYGMGGAPLTVRTVEQATGLRIDHYVQFDFLGFVSAVDALGGVQVCSSRPLRDDYSGLRLPAGTSTLDGPGALAYVRARHLDGTADLGRMRRQQRFVAQLLRRAADGGLLLDPARLAAVTGSVLRSVKADRAFSAQDLLALATRLRASVAGGTDFATVPLADVDHEVAGWGSTVLWDGPAAKALFATVRAGRPIAAPAPKPAPPPPQASPSSFAPVPDAAAVCP